MFEKIKKGLVNHKTLVQNFSYLSALQIFNMLLPLITYPYLIRVLGKETYGLVIFAQAIVGYLVILVSFGFNISATKEVSIYRENKEKLSEIVSSVYIIKGILFFLSILILSIILFLIPKLTSNILLFYLTLWMCLYEFMFPIWYFQGIEQMKYITLTTLVSRLVFLGLIFTFIHNSSDYLCIPIINGIGGIVSGLISLHIVFKKQKIKFKLQPISILINYLRDSYTIFISNISTTFYFTTNKVLLGIFVGMQEVAYYDLAEKLSTVLKTPIQIIGQTIYPRIAQTKNLTFLKNSFRFSLITTLIIVTISSIFSSPIVLFLGGTDMHQAAYIFRILIISAIPVVFSMYYANTILISWGKNKQFLFTRLSSNIVYICIVSFLFFSNLVSVISLALTNLIVEIIVAFLSIYFCRKFDLDFLHRSRTMK